MGDILAYNHATYLIPTYYSYPTIPKYVSVQELFVLSVCKCVTILYTNLMSCVNVGGNL